MPFANTGVRPCPERKGDCKRLAAGVKGHRTDTRNEPRSLLWPPKMHCCPLSPNFLNTTQRSPPAIWKIWNRPRPAGFFRHFRRPLRPVLSKHLQISYVAGLLKSADDDVVSRLTGLLDPQYAAALLMYLSADDRQRFSSHFSEQLKDQVRDLLDYPEGSVGRIMTTDFLTFRQDVRAQEAIDRIRVLARKHFPLSYVYVTDGQGHLAGIMNMRDLMLAPLEAPPGNHHAQGNFHPALFCRSAAAAAVELAKRKFFAAPVVDGENNMLGIIKAERMIQGVRDDVTRDMQKMFGAGGDERVASPIGFALKKRLPWLFVNLATAFLAASAVALFEGNHRQAHCIGRLFTGGGRPGRQRRGPEPCGGHARHRHARGPQKTECSV